ncbi:hypothetical protein EGW08_022851 [Elysia chlorotica]|uniref:Uncharacterized protein n=1 Tax=Elysia chlorotica TaxID=188477 RepID=A0A433SJU1_ELYCH|nr:hypothetical protein EGW08_022851 [Elysia chlorotica]
MMYLHDKNDYSPEDKGTVADGPDAIKKPFVAELSAADDTAPCLTEMGPYAKLNNVRKGLNLGPSARKNARKGGTDPAVCFSTEMGPYAKLNNVRDGLNLGPSARKFFPGRELLCDFISKKSSVIRQYYFQNNIFDLLFCKQGHKINLCGRHTLYKSSYSQPTRRRWPDVRTNWYGNPTRLFLAHTGFLSCAVQQGFLFAIAVSSPTPQTGYKYRETEPDTRPPAWRVNLGSFLNLRLVTPAVVSGQSSQLLFGSLRVQYPFWAPHFSPTGWVGVRIM